MIVMSCASFYTLYSFYKNNNDKLESAENIQGQESLDAKILKIIYFNRALELAKSTECIEEVEVDNTNYRRESVESFIGKSIPSNNSITVSNLLIYRKETLVIYAGNSKTQFFYKTLTESYKGAINVYKPLIQVPEYLGYSIRGPTRAAINKTANKPDNQLNTMKKCEFSKEQKKKVERVAKVLFDYKYIYIEGNNLVFSQFRKSSLVSLLAPNEATKVPIFELIVNEIPKKLSTFAYGNQSFAPLYMAGIVYLLNMHPPAIADYVYHKFIRISNNYNPQATARSAIKNIIDEEEKVNNSSILMSKRARDAVNMGESSKLEVESILNMMP